MSRQKDKKKRQEDKIQKKPQKTKILKDKKKRQREKRIRRQEDKDQKEILILQCQGSFALLRFFLEFLLRAKR